jgi:predicted DCC family thiol-disulfide oxidoreductase YuxK
MHEISDSDWTVEVFYDGDCPLCLREINLLKWLDRRKLVRFTDISAPEFSAQDYGKTADAFMSEIHGRLPDGQWIIGVEVFRRLYSAVGFKSFVWITRLPLISHGLDLGYRVFAKNRLRLTGRCTAETCEVS